MLEETFALPHRVGRVESMIIGLGSLQQMELHETGHAVEI
jgi:hypothetical protein